MIILIYTICIVSIFTFVFLGGILVVYNLKKEISIIETINNNIEDKKNIQKETVQAETAQTETVQTETVQAETAQEERAQIEIVPAEIAKTGWHEIFRVKIDHSYLNLDLFGKKTIQDIINKANEIMFENDSEDYNVLEKKELNNEKRP